MGDMCDIRWTSETYVPVHPKKWPNRSPPRENLPVQEPLPYYDYQFNDEEKEAVGALLSLGSSLSSVTEQTGYDSRDFARDQLLLALDGASALHSSVDVGGSSASSPSASVFAPPLLSSVMDKVHKKKTVTTAAGKKTIKKSASSSSSKKGGKRKLPTRCVLPSIPETTEANHGVNVIRFRIPSSAAAAATTTTTTTASTLAVAGKSIATVFRT